MTKEEAITRLKNMAWLYGSAEREQNIEAIDLAIEALQEPKTIIGIDIPYGSDKGIATLFKGKDEKMVLEEVKEIMSVVRCKDCIHWLQHEQFGFDEDNDEYHDYCALLVPDDDYYAYTRKADDFCSYGERKEL